MWLSKWKLPPAAWPLAHCQPAKTGHPRPGCRWESPSQVGQIDLPVRIRANRSRSGLRPNQAYWRRKRASFTNAVSQRMPPMQCSISLRSNWPTCPGAVGRTDVIHDLLAFLAERIVTGLNKDKADCRAGSS